MAHLIVEADPHGVGYRRGLRAGDSLIAINGEPIIDEIDYQAFAAAASWIFWCSGRTDGRKSCG